MEGEGSEDARGQHEAALCEEAEHLVAGFLGARLGADHEVLDRLREETPDQPRERAELQGGNRTHLPLRLGIRVEVLDRDLVVLHRRRRAERALLAAADEDEDEVSVRLERYLARPREGDPRTRL